MKQKITYRIVKIAGSVRTTKSLKEVQKELCAMQHQSPKTIRHRGWHVVEFRKPDLVPA